jgi:hypothetical protein
MSIVYDLWTVMFLNVSMIPSTVTVPTQMGLSRINWHLLAIISASQLSPQPTQSSQGLH